MTDLEFLTGEATIANASAPKGVHIHIEQDGYERYSILLNRDLVAARLSREAALACIMGIGGAFAFVDTQE